MSANWRCPNCEKPLRKVNKQWSCEHNHCFDEAKQGYVNLLVVQHKNSAQPGDNTEMVNARRQFLNLGYYGKLVTQLAQLVQQYLTLEQFAMLDAGCGEGYYLDSLINHSLLKSKDVHGSGIDISKFAVLSAAKMYKNCQFAVASTFKIPVESESKDLVLQVFAPSKETEIKRVLKSKGIWVLVTPAANHLHELKSLVYKEALAHKQDNDIPVGFELLNRQNLRYRFELHDAQERENLLKMTPFYWSISPEQTQLVSQELHTVTADFDIRVFQKIRS